MLRLQKTRQAVRSLAYSPDGRLLASGGHDKKVHIWDPSSGKEQAALKGHGAAIYAVAFSPDGATLASGGAFVWLQEAGQQPRLQLAVRLWDAASGELREVLEWPTPLSGERGSHFIAGITFRPDGHYLAACTRRAVGGGAVWGGMVRSWRLHNGDGMRWPFEGDVYSIAISANGTMLAIGTEGFVSVREFPNTKEIEASFPHKSRVWAVAFSPDGRLLTSTNSKTVNLWPVEGSTWTVKGPSVTEPIVIGSHEKEVRSLAFSPDGRFLASGGLDGIVTLWDMATRQSRGSFNWELGGIYAVAFAPDGMTMAAAGEQGIVIADVDVP
jgi:WD40 repeat protein